MNVDDGYEAEGTFIAPDSRFFATGGAGIDVPLSTNLRLNAGLRSMLMSDQDIDDVATPSSIYNSWMYTAGVEFSFGGGKSARDVAATERERRMRQMTKAEQEIERLREQRASLRSELDSTSTAYANASDEERAEIERLQSEIESLRKRASQRDTPSTTAEPAFLKSPEAAALDARGHAFTMTSEIGAATGVELLLALPIVILLGLGVVSTIRQVWSIGMLWNTRSK